MTKDFGQNWTQVRIPTLPPRLPAAIAFNQAIPTNDVSQPDYPILGGAARFAGQGNYDITLAVDPTNPNVVYLGGSRRRRPDRPDPRRCHQHLGRPLPGRLLQQRQRRRRARPGLHRPGHGHAQSDLPSRRHTSPQRSDLVSELHPQPDRPVPGQRDACTSSTTPASPTTAPASTWIPFDMGGTDYHRVVTMIDPPTGPAAAHLRQRPGGLERPGQQRDVRDADRIAPIQLPGIDRNGNLQITQFYYGAAQPSNAGRPDRRRLVLRQRPGQRRPGLRPQHPAATATSRWSGPGGDATGVATDQQGTGHGLPVLLALLRRRPDTDFFQYIGPGSAAR